MAYQFGVSAICQQMSISPMVASYLAGLRYYTTLLQLILLYYSK